jgi:GTPase KRas protein
MQSIVNLESKRADAWIIMYSCTSLLSFEEGDKFHDKMLSFCKPAASRKFVLVGNKCDLESDRSITTEQGRSKAEEFGCPFIECSAKKYINITELFELLLQRLLDADEAPDEGGGKGGKGGKMGGGCCDVA